MNNSITTDKNSLLYYKSKWSGQDMPQYNLITIRKKLHYKIYLILFSIVRKYHNLRMKQNKDKKDKTISNISSTEIKDT